MPPSVVPRGGLARPPTAFLAGLWLAAGLAATAIGCGNSASGTPSAVPDGATAQDDTGVAGDTPPSPDATDDTNDTDASEGPTACAPSAGTSGAPSSIADAVALINDLLAQGRTQVTIPCFVESLARPLGIFAVNSVLSAQASDSPHDPRIFLFSGNLVMSVVPAGGASILLELGEYVSPVRSIKAEIVFPRTSPLSIDTLYNRIAGTYGTVCGACHRDEVPVDGGPLNAYISNVLRPRDKDEVPLSAVQAEAAACDRAAQPARCAVFDAVLTHGQVDRQVFSPDAPTIYD